LTQILISIISILLLASPTEYPFMQYTGLYSASEIPPFIKKKITTGGGKGMQLPHHPGHGHLNTGTPEENRHGPSLSKG
jgi:hypothetical protein